jgi:hypothetical protein
MYSGKFCGDSGILVKDAQWKTLWRYWDNRKGCTLKNSVEIVGYS